MKIVTDIKIYNYHLIVSFLNDSVEVIPLILKNDQKIRNRGTLESYRHHISHTNGLNEMTVIRHHLFGVKDTRVTSFPLLLSNEIDDGNAIFSGNEVTQVSIDYKYDNLYLMSNELGIIEWKVTNPRLPRKIKEIIPESFEKLGNPVLSNMVTKKNDILLAIRGYGINKIVNRKQNQKTVLEVRSEDPQDVNTFNSRKIIVIADAFDGIVLYDEMQEKVIKRLMLPGKDFPQQIETFWGDILIKGKYGVYLLDPNYLTLEVLWNEGRVGVMTNYFKYIFFSSQGKLYMIRPGWLRYVRSVSLDQLPSLEHIHLL